MRHRHHIKHAARFKPMAVMLLALLGSGVMLLGLGQSLQAQTAGTPAQADASQTDLRAQVLDAYAKLKTYQGKSSLVIRPEGQPDAQPQKFEYELTFDRPSQTLKLQRMDMTLLVKGQDLKLKLATVAQRHLQMQLPVDQPVYESAIERLPFLGMPIAFDMALLLKQSDVIPADAKAVAADELGRPGLAFDVAIPQQQAAGVVMRLNDKTHLIETVDMKLPLNAQGRAMTILVKYTLSNTKVNQPVDDKALALDLQGSEPVKTLSSLVGQSSGGSSLEGKAAPEFTLKDSQGKDVSLAQLQKQHKVVVIDFWATWCGPCRMTLPGLQKVYQWVQDEKLPVAIYTINQQESVEKATAMFKEMKLTLPILMDSDGKVSTQYEIRAIPQMMVIHDGKVKTVHLGASPTLDEDLKTEIQSLLKGG